MGETVTARIIRTRGGSGLMIWQRALAIALSLVASILFPAALRAEQAYHPSLGYWIDAPTNWQPVGTGNDSVVAFSDPSDRAILQIMSFEADRFDSAESIAEHVRDRLGAAGEVVPYTYLGRDAMLADLTFKGPGGAMRGYFVFLDHPFADHAAFAYVVESAYDDAHDLLLSAVDSFAPTARARHRPGPVSAFLSDPATSGWESREIHGPFGPMRVRLDVTGVTDSQALIEREARILSLFQAGGRLQQGWQDAWRRFYRMVYRDSYARVAPVAETLRAETEERELAREKIPAVLLEWLQDFEFTRTGSLSDLASPTTCMLEMSGDCDGLGLLYVILLHHLGFDAILMVSLEHAHALVGVDVEGSGARFPYRGTEYLVAELTDDVDIGMIAAGMANPADWIGIRLR